MPDYILNVSPPLTTIVSITLDIPDTIPIADFENASNSQYGFLFPFGIGFQSTEPTIPIADFSDALNSQYGFLFAFGSGDPLPATPTPIADFSDSNNSQYGFLFNLGV